jgi:hypothetical protein
LDRDRWSYLAVRAYSKGLVTFEEDERRDVRWQLREEILLSEVERDVLAKLHEMVHLAEASAAQYVDQGVFDHHYKAANKQYRAFSKLTYPFGADVKDIEQGLVDDLVAAWMQEYGDPDSDKVNATIRALKATNG